MGYPVALLNEKEGFDNRISFVSTFDEKMMAQLYDEYVRSCTGVQKEHLPRRCPIRKSPDTGRYELQFDERNLRYNFDALMNFIGRCISEGVVKAAKILDGGQIGGTAYVVTPGLPKKFEFFSNRDLLNKITLKEMTFADVLVDRDRISVSDYLKKN